MLSIVDAADAAVQLQGGSALAVAAVNAARHGGSSIVVSAASVSPSGGGERKRVRRSEFPGMDDAAYRSMMQQRRQQQEKQRDRGRDRTERLYPAREQQRQKEQEYRAGWQKRQATLLGALTPAPAPEPRQAWTSTWTAEVPLLVMDQPLPENPDAWWLRLQRHGFVAGNMLTTTVETDRLYARARDIHPEQGVRVPTRPLTGLSESVRVCPSPVESNLMCTSQP